MNRRLTFLLLLSVLSASAATVRNVPGTYATVQAAVNAAQAGDTVLVAAGTYPENVASVRSGTISSPIIIDGQGVATIWSFLSGHQYVYLYNFTVAGKATGWWLFMDKGGHHNVISNNVFDGQYNDAMDRMVRWNNPSGADLPFNGDQASGCLIVSNTFKRAIGTTVMEIFGDTNTIYGNRLIDGDAVDWFHVWGRTNVIVANLCSNSFVLNGVNHPDCVQAYGLNGAGSSGILIESNTFVNGFGDVQICMFEGQDNSNMHDYTFRNNLFVRIGSKGTMACPDVHWYNNTFFQCATNSAAAAITLIFTWATNSTYTNLTLCSGHGGQVLNNVFLDCGDTNNDRGWYQFDLLLTNFPGTIQADYNYVSRNGYHAVNTNLSHQAVGDSVWNKWQWWEPHGINGGDPNLISASGGDFRPMTNSPLIGAGTNLNALFTTDLDGNIRGSTWDIGAYEYNGGNTPSAPRAFSFGGKLIQSVTNQ